MMELTELTELTKEVIECFHSVTQNTLFLFSSENLVSSQNTNNDEKAVELEEMKNRAVSDFQATLHKVSFFYSSNSNKFP